MNTSSNPSTGSSNPPGTLATPATKSPAAITISFFISLTFPK